MHRSVSHCKTLRKNDTGMVNHTVTSPAGSFTFVNILPGTYTVTVEARGFKRFVQTGLHIEVGVSASILAQLPLGSETDTISVSAQAVTLDTESPAHLKRALIIRGDLRRFSRQVGKNITNSQHEQQGISPSPARETPSLWTRRRLFHRQSPNSGPFWPLLEQKTGNFNSLIA
jgi:hypothetical protein